MSVKYAINGAVTSSSFTVRARITGSSTGALVYSTSADMAGAVTTASVPVSGNATVGNYVTITVTGLQPSTRYYWQVIDNGVTDTAFSGRVMTHPLAGQPASFTFAASSCAGLNSSAPGQVVTNGVSNHPVFDTIRLWDPLFFAHLGDAHYRNISTDDEAAYATAILDTLTYNDTLGANARQGKLYRNAQWAYVWDDHDYANNDSDSTAPGRSAANKIYRRAIPSYEIPEVLGIYQAWVVGRVQFVMWDTRTFRSPDSDPQDPNKTMLGSAQKEWMRGILSTSTAELLVILDPTPWAGRSSDTWAGFQNERQELADMFTSLGWATRMTLITGDRHANAIDTGAGNPWGGFPHYMFGNLDAEGAGDGDTQYDLGLLQGLNQWGQCEIEDLGTSITFTGRAMIGTTVWRSYSFTVQTPVDVPAPVLPIPADPVPKPIVAYYIVDALSGDLVDELPRLDGPLTHVLGASSSSSLTHPILDPGSFGYRPGVAAALTPLSRAILAVVHNVPIWLGTILPRSWSSAPSIGVAAVTSEGYFARRYVGDHVFSQVDQATIAATLLGDAGDIPGVGYGQALTINPTLTGVKRDRTYKASDHKKVYDALRELAQVEGGIEWTVRLGWTSSARTRIQRVAEIGTRLGTASANPDVVYSTHGPARPIYQYSEDHADGKSANYIRAYSSGEGSSQPVSSPAVLPGLLTSGVPIYEQHFQPSSSITDTATLDAHARAQLARIGGGTKTWKVSVLWDAWPRLGVDYQLGDDIALELEGPAHPDGIKMVVRPIGFSGLDPKGGRMDLIFEGADS